MTIGPGTRPGRYEIRSAIAGWATSSGRVRKSNQGKARAVNRRFNLLDGDTHMRRAFAATLVGAVVLVCSPLAQTGGGRLQIAWIDVEGGASTLFVAPNGQSL